jgi:tripartite-type tricarboxylate transporter receptor subunit TctC
MAQFMSRAVLGALCLVTLPLFAANAESSAEFYSKTKLRMVIGAGPGGGNDTYARLVARHFTSHMPGKPKVIPQNRPGASGLVGLNYLYVKAPKDGSAFGTFNRGMLIYNLLDGKGARFDVNKLNWLGSINKEIPLVIAWHKVPVKSFADLKSRGLIVAGTAAGNDSVTLPALINNLLGTKITIVAGYPTGEAMNLAMLRGEVEGRGSMPWTTLKATRPDWVRDSKVNVVMQFSISRHPGLPKVPAAAELAPNEEVRQIIELYAAKNEMGRPYAAPPGVPAERVAILRKAFMATITDPAFAKAAEKLKLEIAAIDGSEMQDMLKRIYATPKAVVERAKEVAKNREPLKMAKIPLEKALAKIEGIKRGGRRVIIKNGGKKVTLRVSKSKTKVTIGGKKAKRGALKTGMDCAFEFKATAAEKIVCK